MKRRKFLGFVSLTEALISTLRPAIAQTWQKLGQVITRRSIRLPSTVDKRRRHMIAGAGAITMAIRSDGFVIATGTNSRGQLGDSTQVSKLTYVQAIGISNAVAIATANNSTMALRSDGLIFATGSNLSGQLGDNTIVSKLTYIQAFIS